MILNKKKLALLLLLAAVVLIGYFVLRPLFSDDDAVSSSSCDSSSEVTAEDAVVTVGDTKLDEAGYLALRTQAEAFTGTLMDLYADLCAEDSRIAEILRTTAEEVTPIEMLRNTDSALVYLLTAAEQLRREGLYPDDGARAAVLNDYVSQLELLPMALTFYPDVKSSTESCVAAMRTHLSTVSAQGTEAQKAALDLLAGGVYSLHTLYDRWLESESDLSFAAYFAEQTADLPVRLALPESIMTAVEEAA